jgi:DNA-binding transcriptional LysR family regulator
VEEDLRSGELVKAFDFLLDRASFTYYLLTPSDRPERPQMTAFRQWILERSVGPGGPPAR